jgi:hypothetical protein
LDSILLKKRGFKARVDDVARMGLGALLMMLATSLDAV